jgi:hypothetical protein
MNDVIFSLVAIALSFLAGFWVGSAYSTARGVRYGYAAGLRHAKNMLRRRQ